jgi:phosphoheptose isomerase
MTTVHDRRDGGPLTGRPLTGFPVVPHQSMGDFFDAYAAESAKGARSVDQDALEAAAAILIAAYTRGSRVFCCGNGGSAAIANHLLCDHIKGIRTGTDLAPRVVSLSASVELLTAISNDIAFADVFAYQLQAQASRGDVLIAISSSGRSPNIIRALTWAGSHGMATIALTGFDGGEAREVADVSVHVDVANYGIIEDLHHTIMHVLAQYIRQSRMTPDAIMTSVF